MSNVNDIYICFTHCCRCH